jgi:hypothetical protein
MVEAATPSSSQAEVILVGKFHTNITSLWTGPNSEVWIFTLNVILTHVLSGCGMPLRGMGWYHAVQMLGGECPSAKLCHIVEPWFLGPGASG